jgi:hypothetical protein
MVQREGKQQGKKEGEGSGVEERKTYFRKKPEKELSVNYTGERKRSLAADEK